jgi:asparagine synthase (glutamine-hydrolysing)
LAKRHGLTTNSDSDCSIIGPLFRKLDNPAIFFKALDGVFATLIYDEKNNCLYAGRDPYGVRPMFFGKGKVKGTFFGSELKSIVEVADQIVPFKPGHWAKFDGNTGQMVNKQAYHHVPFLKNPLWSPEYKNGLELAKEAVRESLIASVHKRMMTERPVAALLSGGIDSSLVASLVQRELKRLGKPALKTFSIGFPGSPDLKYAKMVAEHIKSDHTEVICTPD